MDHGEHEDEEFLSGLASVMLGRRVGSVDMPLYGMSQAGVVYGTPETGLLHVNADLMARVKADLGYGSPGDRP